MSFELYFIKKDDLNINNVYPILEAEDVNQSNDFFVSKRLMVDIQKFLIDNGLKFEMFEGKKEDYFELNFPSYQLSMFNSQIVISIPYWDENSTDKVNKEIKIITNVLIENGFTGFDSQTEEFITQKYIFQKTFSETKLVVDDNFNKFENNSLSNNSIRYIGIGLVILIIGIVIWKMKSR